MSLKEELQKEAFDAAQKQEIEQRKKRDEEIRIYKENCKRWESELAKELGILPEKLKSLARQGERKFVIRRDCGKFDDYLQMISEFAKTNDLSLSTEEIWCPPERGDPESGEGACDAGWVYLFTLSW